MVFVLVSGVFVPVSGVFVLVSGVFVLVSGVNSSSCLSVSGSREEYATPLLEYVQDSIQVFLTLVAFIWILRLLWCSKPANGSRLDADSQSGNVHYWSWGGPLLEQYDICGSGFSLHKSRQRSRQRLLYETL